MDVRQCMEELMERYSFDEMCIRDRYYTENCRRINIQSSAGNKTSFLKSLQDSVQLLFQGVIILYLARETVLQTILVSDFIVLYNSIMEIENNLNNVIQTIPKFYENSRCV